MKSSENQLIARGMIPKGKELDHISCSFSDQLMLLKSTQAFERSIAARLLGTSGNPDAVAHLCNALVHEKKLYTKIEICNALSLFGLHSIPALIPLLGAIGSNQHKSVPNNKFGKQSYPLPRDIVARVLIRIGVPALPALKKVLINGSERQISEAVDAIGHISYNFNDKSCYQIITDSYLKYKTNKLMVWKIVRAMGAFPNSVGFLNQMLEVEIHPGIKHEIKRSLELIVKK
jgi:HEAT repeat protein